MFTANTKRAILGITNFVTCAAWLRCLFLFFDKSVFTETEVCDTKLRPALILAIYISSLELANSLLRITRSSPLFVLLFIVVRGGTEVLVPPAIGCAAWQHLWTALFWSMGEVVRFGCFTYDVIFPEQKLAKTIRYTMGPVFFTGGALGEMLMVIRAASQGSPLLYFAAALWPAGFYPLMKQLLKQKEKHLRSSAKKPEIRKV